MRPEYRTLFYGLRKNHPHNVAVVHPVSFLLRRVLYSLIIVFMASDILNVLYGCMLLLMTCLWMMLLILVEGEWESRMINWQHLVNEAILYILLCVLICFCGLINDIRQNVEIGYIMIAIICALIIYNIIVILYDTFYYAYLLSIRYQVQLRQLWQWLRTRNWRCRDPNDPTPACRRWYRQSRAWCSRVGKGPSKTRAWCFKKF